MKSKKLHFSIAALLAWTVAAAAETPSAIAIKDAHVVTVSGQELAKGTVVLRDGLIEGVGEGLAIPADAWVIEGAGLTVYPGFIDGLSTWGIPAPPAATGAARSAATAPTPPPPIRGPEDRPQSYAYERAADMVSPADSRLTAARAAGFAAAATFPNRGIVEGLGAMVNLAGERGRDMVVAQPIGQQIFFRVGGGGLGRSFPSSLMGNMAYIRQLYLDLAQYEQAKQIYAAHPPGNKRPAYDHTLEALAESPRLLFPAEESQQIDRILRFGKELKKPFIVYGLHEGYRSIDEIKQADVPVLVSLKWPEKPKNTDPAERPDLRDLEMRDQAPSVPGLLAKASVRFGFYSDGVDSAPDLKKALKRALDAGLSREDAVKALTLNVAEMYGVADRMGSVEKGKIADLVVMKGDAFDDKTTVEYVLVDGTLFEPSKDLQKASPKSGGAPHALDGGLN